MISIGSCCTCKCEIRLPDDLYNAARRSSKISFFCSYGHEQHFTKGESEETKLRRERDRLVQRIAEKDDEIGRQMNLRNAAERSAMAMRGQVTKIKNRVGRGVCPCCNRQFENLHRHMSSQHPAFIAEAAE